MGDFFPTIELGVLTKWLIKLRAAQSQSAMEFDLKVVESFHYDYLEMKIVAGPVTAIFSRDLTTR